MLNLSVKKFVTTKPDGYTYTPGQATNITLNREGYRSEPRPFTFTGLPEEDELEFVIKLYFERDGVTDEMATVSKDDTFEIEEPKGEISYKGPGLFIAGGAGLTPFLPIFRQLDKEGEMGAQELWFINSEESDIFLEDELRELFEEDSIRFILTDEEGETNYESNYVDEGYLETNLDRSHEYIYVCGPPEMTEEICEILSELGVKESKIVKEDWSD